MIRKFMLSLLILIAATTAAHAEEQSFSDRKAHLTEIHALRVGYGSGTVRIVLDVAKPLEFTESYVENPSRMILDLKNAWLNSTVQKEIELKSLAAKKVRIAQFNPTTVRIVIETAAATKPFNLAGGTTGHRFVIDIGNDEYKENPELNKPEQPKPAEPTKPPATEIPKDVEVVDTDALKEQQEQRIKEQREREKELLAQREREKQERELKEKRERELKEQQERALKEQQEQRIKEQREREKQLKEQQEREKREKELKEKREKELKEQQERALKEQQEQRIKEQREREKQLKEQEKREKRERDKKAKDKDKDKSKDKNDGDKEVDTPFGKLDTDLEDITALGGRVIVIDPGHGGNDAGAIGPTGVMEKSVTLKVALELRKLLEAEGATVIMTRETDTTVSYKGAKASDIEELGARCEVANRAGADIFISIHADSFTRPEARGTTGYYYSGSTTGRGQRLADCIRRNLVEQLGTPSRGTQPCNFYVVRHTDMPATLIELGFISNKDEEKLLDSKEGVQKAAQGILDGIEDYFG